MFFEFMPRTLSLLSASLNAAETIVRACLSVDTQKLPPGLLVRTSDSGRELERRNVGTSGCPTNHAGVTRARAQMLEKGAGQGR